MTTRIIQGDWIDVLRTLPDESVHCVVTSPPYWGLRDYGIDGQLGLERTPDEYVWKIVQGFREARRVLRSDGTCWLNLGDSYYRDPKKGDRSEYLGLHKNIVDSGCHKASQSRSIPEGMKPKDLCMIPSLCAMALRADGWYLRSSIIWAKPNGMPNSQDDRPTSSYEFIFLLTKSPRYWSDFDAIKTPPRESLMIRTAQNVQAQAGSHRANGGGKTNGTMKAVGGKQRGHSRRHDGFNARWDAMDKAEQRSMPAMIRDVWFVSPAQYAEAHFAVMPQEIARRCIAAGCPQGGTVLDPFNGSGTTGLVAARLGCDYIGIDLNTSYNQMAISRIVGDAPLFNTVIE